MTGVRENCTLKAECLVPVVIELQLLDIPSKSGILGRVKFPMVDIVNQPVHPNVPGVAVHTVKPKQHDAVGHLFPNALHRNQGSFCFGVILRLELSPHVVTVCSELFHVRLTVAERCRRERFISQLSCCRECVDLLSMNFSQRTAELSAQCIH